MTNFLKPESSAVTRVGAGVQVQDLVAPFASVTASGDAGFGVGDRDGDAGQHGAGGVGDRAGEGAARILRGRGACRTAGAITHEGRHSVLRDEHQAS